MSAAHRTTWILVAGGFHQRGGMDKANYALAEYLATTGRPVHLVSHAVEESLIRMPLVEATLVERPCQSVFLGEFALDWAGRQVKKRLALEGRESVMVANGSNCLVGDVNWVHYVHSAWQPNGAGQSVLARFRNGLQRSILCHREHSAFQRAKLILTNSNLTTDHVAICLQGESRKVSTIYLGADPLLPVQESERTAARNRWGIPAGVPVAAFVGSFGLDSRKGFDVLLKAWQRLCQRRNWDAQLLVAGDGPALRRFRQEAAVSKASRSIRFLGFCDEVDSVLAASDVLISPVRYEPYGLNVQEALSRGLAVLTSASAGIAERFSSELSPLLIRDPESVEECVEKILHWLAGRAAWSHCFERLGTRLRQRSWRMMSKEFVHFVEARVDATALAVHNS